MKRKKQNNELTGKDRFAAMLIGALCIPLFLAAFFVYEKITAVPSTAPSAAAPVDGAVAPETALAPAAKPADTPPADTPPPVLKKTPAKPNAPKPAANLPRPETVSVITPAAKLPEERPAPKPRRDIVYVIDDAGNNLRELEPFLRFPGPLTIAVLPGLPNSARAARMVREAGKELFLHQPMEAVGGADPGPGAIYKGMSADEVRAVLEQNVREIGPVAGMNNHQGSLITEDEEIMRVVLEFCRDNKLYFLDSRTSAKTVAPKISRELGITIAARNIFLDNEHNADAIISNIELGLNMAREKNSAVMIGHAWSPELAGIISSGYAGLNDQGYNFLTVSDIMRGKTAP
ncbi:MAG: divergent polysaccharide deacetylase family protein [Spirochaetaceae bacterium]|nr:divergent polysaccharide deacetylase family protein [Spirochaetaceae bacterium]